MVDYVATPEACLSASHPGEEALLPDLSDYKINRHFSLPNGLGRGHSKRLGAAGPEPALIQLLHLPLRIALGLFFSLSRSAAT